MNRRPAEVLYLACWGVTHQVMQARALGIGLESVRRHRAVAFRALGAACQAQAVYRVWPIFVEASHARD